MTTYQTIENDGTNQGVALRGLNTFASQADTSSMTIDGLVPPFNPPGSITRSAGNLYQYVYFASGTSVAGAPAYWLATSDPTTGNFNVTASVTLSGSNVFAGVFLASGITAGSWVWIQVGGINNGIVVASGPVVGDRLTATASGIFTAATSGVSGVDVQVIAVTYPANGGIASGVCEGLIMTPWMCGTKNINFVSNFSSYGGYAFIPDQIDASALSALGATHKYQGNLYRYVYLASGTTVAGAPAFWSALDPTSTSTTVSYAVTATASSAIDGKGYNTVAGVFMTAAATVGSWIWIQVGGIVDLAIVNGSTVIGDKCIGGKTGEFGRIAKASSNTDEVFGVALASYAAAGTAILLQNCNW